MTDNKPLVWFQFPMPSFDSAQKAFKRRFEFIFSNRLESAVIHSKDMEEGNQQLQTNLNIKIFTRDLCEKEGQLKELVSKLDGLAPMIRMLIDGIYTTPEGEELPMIKRNGKPAPMPVYFLDPSDREGGRYAQQETFTMRDVAHFLHNSEFREPRAINNGRDSTPFRQAVGGTLEAGKVGDDAHSAKRVFTGTVFGRYPFRPTIEEREGTRYAVFTDDYRSTGYMTFMPMKTVVLLLNTFVVAEPFFQNVVAHWSGFSHRAENRVRGLLPAPREQRKASSQDEASKAETAEEGKVEGDKPKAKRNRRRNKATEETPEVVTETKEGDESPPTEESGAVTA